VWIQPFAFSTSLIFHVFPIQLRDRQPDRHSKMENRENSSFGGRQSQNFGEDQRNDSSPAGASSSRTRRPVLGAKTTTAKRTSGGSISSRLRRLNTSEPTRESSIRSHTSSQATRLSTVTSDRPSSILEGSHSRFARSPSPVGQRQDDAQWGGGPTVENESDSFIFIGIDFGTT
jgi:hypothetical protein